MESVQETLIQDREQAGRILSGRLSEYRYSNAVVVGIPHGGVCVAAAIAEALRLPLEVMPCRRIKHPVTTARDVGSVSLNEVYIHDFLLNVPQDYIYHQIRLLQASINGEMKFYYGDILPNSFLYKTVILADDILRSSDSVIACIRSIRKQKPLKIIVVAPVVSAEVASTLRQEVDEIIFLRLEQIMGSPHHYFIDFPGVTKEEVQKLLQNSRRKLQLT